MMTEFICGRTYPFNKSFIVLIKLTNEIKVLLVLLAIKCLNETEMRHAY